MAPRFLDERMADLEAEQEILNFLLEMLNLDLSPRDAVELSGRQLAK